MCQVSVGVLGDVCRAIEARIAPFCDKIMSVLLTNLQSNDVQRNIKPQILSAFGDVAIAIGDAFEAYLPHVLQMLQSAQARPLQAHPGSAAGSPASLAVVSWGCSVQTSPSGQYSVTSRQAPAEHRSR